MKPKSILPVVRGFMRDFALDALPEGYVWDVKDFIPQRKGSRMESRGAWAYMTETLGGQIWGGYYGRFPGVEKLIVVGGGTFFDVNIQTGALSAFGSTGFPSMVQNGVMLRGALYFMDGSGVAVPKKVTVSGTTPSYAAIHSSAPKAKVGVAYKDRLVLGSGSDVYFSPLETEGGPSAAWDADSKIFVTREVYGMAAAPGRLICFHAGRISRIAGSIPPGSLIDSDMSVDTLTDQVGCTLPATICYWNENILFADERGVFMTDGAIVKNLTEQGGISDFWREAYANRAAGNSICCGVYFDYLVASILLTNGTTFLLLCDLNSRAWFRFTNYPTVALIPSEGSFEELYAGHYPVHRLVRSSDLFGTSSLLSEIVPPGDTADQVDGNGLAVLPSMESGWERLGPEGVIQAKQVYVSYRHQSYDNPLLTDAVQVSWRRDPAATSDLLAYDLAGRLPSVNAYTRKRLPLGGRVYGVQIKVEALRPFHLFNISDVAVASGAGDHGKVTA